MSKCLLQQVLKEKKPLTDWSNITGSSPCMMSVSPLTVHKAPQVGATSSCSSKFQLVIFDKVSMSHLSNDCFSTALCLQLAVKNALFCIKGGVESLPGPLLVEERNHSDGSTICDMTNSYFQFSQFGPFFKSLNLLNCKFHNQTTLDCHQHYLFPPGLQCFG